MNKVFVVCLYGYDFCRHLKAFLNKDEAEKFAKEQREAANRKDHEYLDLDNSCGFAVEELDLV